MLVRESGRPIVVAASAGMDEATVEWLNDVGREVVASGRSRRGWRGRNPDRETAGGSAGGDAGV